MTDVGTVKLKVAQAREFLLTEGLVGAFGHVSYYLPEEQIVIMTPITSSVRAHMGADDMLTMTLDGEVLQGEGVAPKESVIHTSIHRARPDALAVIHTHPFFSTNLSIAGEKIRPVYMHGAILEREVPVYDDPDMITTEPQGTRLVEALGSTARAVELRGHGSVTIGRTVEEAFAIAVFLEENSRKQFYSKLAGQTRFLSDDEIQRLHASTINDFLLFHFWDFYEKYRSSELG